MSNDFKHTSYIDNYNSRTYVGSIRSGHRIFLYGMIFLFFGLELVLIVGALIAFCAGLSHHFDSRKRIKALKAELKEHTPSFDIASYGKAKLKWRND